VMSMQNKVYCPECGIVMAYRFGHWECDYCGIRVDGDMEDSEQDMNPWIDAWED